MGEQTPGEEAGEYIDVGEYGLAAEILLTEWNEYLSRRGFPLVKIVQEEKAVSRPTA